MPSNHDWPESGRGQGQDNLHSDNLDVTKFYEPITRYLVLDTRSTSLTRQTRTEKEIIGDLKLIP